MTLKLTSGNLVAALNLPAAAVVHEPVTTAAQPGLAHALQNPLGLPVLPECVVPGDRAVIVVDPETPDVANLVTQVWEQFQVLKAQDLDVTLLLPADSVGDHCRKLVDDLPVHVRSQLAVHVHDPTDENQRRYLASSAGGERLYLSHYLTDADLIISVGMIGFDALYGYRGTNSAIYPEFSSTQAIHAAKKYRDHDLTPEDRRPLRDLVDEIGWLLGTQFTVQIVPGPVGGIAATFCGLPDMALAAGKQLLNDQRRLALDEEVHLAVVSIPGKSCFGWKQVGAAVETAARLVGDDGRIAVVAELPQHVGPGLEMLRRCRSPEDLLQPLLEEPPEDALEVTQLIHVLRTSEVYLFSNLDASFIEDFGMQPLSTEAELQRVIDSSDSVIVIPDANYTWAQVGAESRVQSR